MDQEKLIKDCIKNKRKAQKKLYEYYASTLLGICFRYFPHNDIAHDILQESFIKIFKNLKEFKGHGSFEGWMKRICINTALSELRKKNKLIFKEEFEMEALKLETTGNENDIISLITKLPDGYREIFNLHGIEGYSFKEIAQLVDLTEGNVRVKYHRARKKMQEILEKYFMEIT